MGEAGGGWGRLGEAGGGWRRREEAVDGEMGSETGSGWG